MRKILISIIFLSSPASGHSWYDLACCSERHCKPFHGTIYRNKTDYILEDEGTTFIFPERDVRQSEDDDYRICKLPDETGVQIIRCLYVPRPKGY